MNNMRYENYRETVKMKNTLGNVLSTDMQKKLNSLRKQVTTDSVEARSISGSSPDSKLNKSLNNKSKQNHDNKITSFSKPRFDKQDLQNYFERINKSQDWLESTWPQLFNRESPKPLKRHIEKDILPHVPEGLSRLQVREAIYAYVKRRAYLESILSEGSRYDLNGTAVEAISEQQKEFTRDALRIKQEKAEERQRLNEARKEYFALKKRVQSVVSNEKSTLQISDSSNVES